MTPKIENCETVRIKQLGVEINHPFFFRRNYGDKWFKNKN